MVGIGKWSRGVSSLRKDVRGVLVQNESREHAGLEIQIKDFE